MKKLLFFAIALLTSSLAWAQPQAGPGDPEFVSDLDIICSYSKTCPWYGAASAYTYPESSITLNYMHFNVTQGSGSARQWEGTNNFSANEKEYVHLEIYPMADVNLTLDFPTGGTQTVLAELKANQWNSLNYDLADFGVTNLSSVSNLRFRSYESDADFYVDNYYYHHGVKPAGPMSSPGKLEYNSDQDIICSYKGVTTWFGGYSGAVLSPYTYPGTTQEINYMHMVMPKNGYMKETTNYDFSANETEYVHFEIWTQTNTTLSLKLSAKSNGTDLTVNLTGGQWNSFDYDLVADLGATTLNGVGTVRFKALADNGADIYVDNYYFHHRQAPSAPKLVVGEPDEEGVAIVSGPVTVATVTDFLAEIQDEKYKDIVLYNLAGANYDAFPGSGAFTTRWTAANPNALFGILWKANTYANRFVDPTNVGFINSENKKFYRFGNVVFADGYDMLYPTYTIGTVGSVTPAESTISYTRSGITTATTAVLPFAAAVPTGVSAYGFDSADMVKNELTFKPVTTMEAFKPYIIVGSSLNVSTSEDIVLPTPAAVEITSDMALTGTFQAFGLTTAEDNVYVLTGDADAYQFTQSVGEGIGAFRGFLRLTPSAASGPFTVILDEETVGIETIDKESLTHTVFDLQGRRVGGQMSRGIYVVNGKKVVVK